MKIRETEGFLHSKLHGPEFEKRKVELNRKIGAQLADSRKMGKFKVTPTSIFSLTKLKNTVYKTETTKFC